MAADKPTVRLPLKRLVQNRLRFCGSYARQESEACRSGRDKDKSKQIFLLVLNNKDESKFNVEGFDTHYYI